MKFGQYLLAGALALSASSTAFAAGTDMSGGPSADGTNGAGLTTAGVKNSAGAAWAANALALDSGAQFDASFNFTITPYQPEGPLPGVGNGFTFFLTTDTTGLGTTNPNLGFGTNTSPSLAVQFSTNPNLNNNPLIPGTSTPYSNLVAVSEDGNMVIKSPVNAPYAPVYGVNTCSNGSEGAGCLANAQLWNANISYANGLLTVTLKDALESTSFTFTDSGLNLASLLGSGELAAGFSASNGNATETVGISNFSLSVPEPASLAAFGIGLAALGFARSRRRAA